MLLKFGSLRNLKKVLTDYRVNHGTIQTFQKIVEILFISLRYKNAEIGKKEFLSEQDVEWIEQELKLANKLDPLIDNAPSRLMNPVFAPIAEAVTIIIKNINKKKQNENLSFQNIVVGPRISKYLNKKDSLTLTAFETNPLIRCQGKVISLNEGFRVANKKSRMRILLLVCFTHEIQSVTLLDCKFNKEFLNNYGEILKKFNSKLIINWI